MANETGPIKKGDKVKVIAGNQKGKIGTVMKVLSDKGSVIVENLNKVKRHQKPGGAMRQGGIIEKEAPIHASNVMVLCGKCTQAVRVRYKVLEGQENGKKVKVRACAKCGEHLDSK